MNGKIPLILKLTRRLGFKKKKGKNSTIRYYERDLNFFVIKVENRGVKKQSQSKVSLLISVKEEFKAKSIEKNIS